MIRYDLDNLLGERQFNIPLALVVEVQADCVSAGISNRLCIFDAGNPADFNSKHVFTSLGIKDRLGPLIL